MLTQQVSEHLTEQHQFYLAFGYLLVSAITSIGLALSHPPGSLKKTDTTSSKEEG